jgi:hypothetical protein
MRKQTAAVLLAAMIMSGCASGPINPTPAIKRPDSAVTVTIERNRSLVGAPATMFFVINNQRVYALQIGQRWSFRIDAGEHRFGYDLGFNSCRQRVMLEPGKRYFVKLTPICEIEPRPF